MSPTNTHPVTYNHYLTETVQKVRNERLVPRLEKAAKNLCNSPWSSTRISQFLGEIEPDMERVAASDAIDYMEAYYKVALKTFVDNVSLLVVERCLIEKLPDLFTPDSIYDISDEDVAELAAENSDATAERTRLMEKMACLEKCESELRRLDKHRIPVLDDTTPKY